MMARNPMPLLQEVVMLVILTPGRSLVISCAHSREEGERREGRGGGGIWFKWKGRV